MNDLKLYIEVDLTTDNEELLKEMINDLATVIPNMIVKYHVSAPGKIDSVLLKKYLNGILNDPQFSRNIKFNSDEEYELYCSLAAVVKAPITGRKF